MPTAFSQSHTILGSKSQRGLTQLAIDLLYSSIGSNILTSQDVLHQLVSTDNSEAHIITAFNLLEPAATEGESRQPSRAQTPTPVSSSPTRLQNTGLYKSFIGLSTGNLHSRGKGLQKEPDGHHVINLARITKSAFAKFNKPLIEKDLHVISTHLSNTSRRLTLQLASLPRSPRIDDIKIESEVDTDYAVLISMWVGLLNQ